MNTLQEIWLKEYTAYLKAQVEAYAIPGIKRPIQPAWLDNAVIHANKVVAALNKLTD